MDLFPLIPLPGAVIESTNRLFSLHPYVAKTPSIKNKILLEYHLISLYSLDAVASYKELGYRIAPNMRVDYEHLVGQWDNILRFVASIKLGYVQGSTLLKRLKRSGVPVL